MRLLGFVGFDPVSLTEANEMLTEWGHKMGPLKRGNQGAASCHALWMGDEALAVATASTLIMPVVGGGCSWMTRDNTIELSRLCLRCQHPCSRAGSGPPRELHFGHESPVHHLGSG